MKKRGGGIIDGWSERWFELWYSDAVPPSSNPILMYFGISKGEKAEYKGEVTLHSASVTEESTRFDRPTEFILKNVKGRNATL